MASKRRGRGRRTNSRNDQSQSPISDQSDDETSDESGQELHRNRDLVRNSFLNEVSVGLDSSRHFSGTNVVEISDVLAQDGFEVAFSNSAGGCFSSENPGLNGGN